MTDINSKMKKSFESINKNLYRTNKVLELYSPLRSILNNLILDYKNISEVAKKNEHLEKDIEEEIKKRELISLFKKMNTTVSEIKEEMDVFYKEMKDADSFLEKFRSYRTYMFADTLKTKEYIEKLLSSFDIQEFVLKFNVVGTVDLVDVANKVKGKKQGIDIIVFSENLNLIFDEILKSKTVKFRLATKVVTIYFEKDTVLYIEGPSKKIKLCDIEAQNFNAKILEV
jgi:hypothetical protein